MNRLHVPKFYQLQHKILFQAWDMPRVESGQVVGVSIEYLTSINKKPESVILRAVNYLLEKELVHQDPTTNQVYCRPKGKIALFKEDLLEEGWEKFKANFLRWSQIFGIVSGSFIAICTFTMNVQTTNKNTTEIQTLKQEVQVLKQKQVSVPRSRVPPSRPALGRDSVKTK